MVLEGVLESAFFWLQEVGWPSMSSMASMSSVKERLKAEWKWWLSVRTLFWSAHVLDVERHSVLDALALLGFVLGNFLEHFVFVDWSGHRRC